MRLATWIPFEQARELLQKLLGIQVRKATALRAPLTTGEVALAVWEAEVERLQQEVPQAPDGADQQLLSADGAEWLQGLVNYHRPDAMRILDFAHAAGAASRIGEAVRGAGGRLPTSWLEGVLHRLKHQGPARMLKHLTKVVTRCPSEASSASRQKASPDSRLLDPCSLGGASASNVPPMCPRFLVNHGCW
jgi:hypothetical protein